MKTKRAFFWNASLWRAALEASLAAALLICLGLIPLEVPELIAGQWLFTISVAAGSVLGLRLKPIEDSRFMQILRASLVAVLSGVVLPLLTVGLSYAFSKPDYLSSNSLGALLSAVILFLSGSVFLFWRVFRLGWLRWQQLRRSHFQWNLTHAHLSVIAVLFLLLLVASFIYTVFQTYPSNVQEENLTPLVRILSNISRTLLPQVMIFAFMTAVALGIAAPPLIAFSYFISRRLTKRVKDLAETTQQLREGDLSARAQVSGEDEIAQLQMDFNAMAEKLEQSSAQLQTERDRVAGLLKAQRELTATVSHELRTPVATLLGYLENNLNNPKAGLPGSVLDDLEIMQHETERLQNLIDDLFTLSQAEVNKLSLECSAVDLTSLVQRTVETIRPLAWQNSRVEIVADLPEDLLPVWADAMRLEQILRNLLQNALRHTPPGGIIAISATAQDTVVRLSVADTGEGISAEDLPHIWERFYRGKDNHHRGTGLGLALVKELVEAMDGSVGAESTVGEGSRFWVDLKPAP